MRANKIDQFDYYEKHTAADSRDTNL